MKPKLITKNYHCNTKSDQGQLKKLKHNIETINNNHELEKIKSNCNINYNNTYNLINEVSANNNQNNYKTPDITGDKQLNNNKLTPTFCAQNALFFNNSTHIFIPKKVLHVLQTYVSKFQLRKIDADLNVAIEYCLLFLMNMYSGYNTNENIQEDAWKSLKSAYLRAFFTTNPLCYKKIIEVLSTPTSKGIIIECDGIYVIGSKNYHYRLADNYRAKGYSNYALQTKQAKDLLMNYNEKIRYKAEKNIICQNLIKFYQSVTLPTLVEIENEANRLISIKYKNKKGKTLKRLNKHSKSYYVDSQKYSFVEDSIKIFQRLTANGIMIPIAGNDASGGRVIDCFTLMPSWIRNLIKINDKPIIECDYACLHPNIAACIYGGISRYITHKMIAKSLFVDEHIVKVEHLSFFNEEVWQMKQSQLYDYYNKFENWMLNNIINEKQFDPNRHKITSRKLFAMEVNIMSEVINILNQENIYVGYVYDALFFDPIHAKRVQEVMDHVIIQFGVFTKSKLNIVSL